MTDNWDNNWWESTGDDSNALDLPEDADFREDISWHGQKLPDAPFTGGSPTTPDPARPAPRPPISAQPPIFAQPLDSALPPAPTAPPPTWNSYQAPLPSDATTSPPSVYQPSTPPPAHSRKQKKSAPSIGVIIVAILVVIFAANSAVHNDDDDGSYSSEDSTMWSDADPSLTTGLVEIDPSAGDAEVQGSGIVVDDNTVATPYHLVAGATSIKVTSADGTKTKATMLGFDASKDIAILKANLPDSEPVDTSSDSVDDADDDGSAVVVDNTVYNSPVQANPPLIATEGQIEVDSTFLDNGTLASPLELLEFAFSFSDELPVPGMNWAGPGAAVFDNTEQLMGMILDTQGDYAYAIPAGALAEVLFAVQKGKDNGTTRVGPAGDLGLTSTDTDENGYPIVESVTRNGPAAKAGITKGDTLVAIDGTDLTGDPTLGLEGIIRSLEPGDKTKVTVIPAKGGPKKTYTLTVEKSKSA